MAEWLELRLSDGVGTARNMDRGGQRSTEEVGSVREPVIRKHCEAESDCFERTQSRSVFYGDDAMEEEISHIFLSQQQREQFYSTNTLDIRRFEIATILQFVSHLLVHFTVLQLSFFANTVL